MKKQILLITVSLIAVLVSISACTAATYYVSTTGNNANPGTDPNLPLADISTGVNKADADTVIIATGTYTGAANKNIVISKDMTIQGAGDDETIIDCDGVPSGRAFRVNTGIIAVIKDLTIKNGEDLEGGAIVNYGTLTVNDCTFEDNHVNSFGGAIANYGTCNVNNCIFNSNDADFSGGALFNYDGSLNVVGCNFFDNTAGSYGAAIFGANPQEASTTTVKYSRFVNNLVGTTPQDLYLRNPEQVREPSTMTATLNWWGDNNGPTATRVGYSGNVPITYSPWLVLNIYANPSTIYIGQTSLITADVYTDSNGVNHRSDISQFFSGPEVTLDPKIPGSGPATSEWVYGQTSILGQYSLAGIFPVTATDIQTVTTNITVLETPTNGTAKAATVEMRETGMPIFSLVLGILALFGGLAISKRK